MLQLKGILTVTGCLKIEAVCLIGGTKLASALSPRARSYELESVPALFDPPPLLALLVLIVLLGLLGPPDLPLLLVILDLLGLLVLLVLLVLLDLLDLPLLLVLLLLVASALLLAKLPPQLEGEHC